MKREIKFRALFESLNPSEDQDRFVWQYLGINHFNGFAGLVQKSNWEQYTGLKDSNGIEIYEGDVVNTGDAQCAVVNIGEISLGIDDWGVEYISNCIHITWTKWHNSNYALTETGNGYSLKSSEIEVIGNIHQNPELIK